MEALIKKLFDLQFELTMLGAELDEKINRIKCQPGIHELVKGESRNLILMAANIKYDIKVLKLALSRIEKSQAESKDSKDANASLSDIETLYYQTFKRFVQLIEKLENNPLNTPVEEVVRNVWTRLGETYQQFRKIVMGMEYFLSEKR
jgi:cell division protein ZapA (FtsZ GTPase activity inhibitor)